LHIARIPSADGGWSPRFFKAAARAGGGIFPYTPPQPTPEQIAAVREASRIKSEREHQKYLQGQTNAVHWLLPQATNGYASAQYSLGEHYLAGLGCETNRDLAIQWLQKAADGGSVEASNKLSQLKSP